MHRLDEKSPLHGLDETNFEEKFLAFVVQIEGTDQTYMQKVFANKCYYPTDFRFNESFEDIMTMGSNTITVDLTGLSKTREVDEKNRLSFLRANTFSPDEAKKMNAFAGRSASEESTRLSPDMPDSEKLEGEERLDQDQQVYTAAC